MKLVLYYFRCTIELSIPIPIRYRTTLITIHSTMYHVIFHPCLHTPSMPPQANRNVPIRATRPTASLRPSSSTTMRAITWACSAGRASYRSRRTEITLRGRLSGQNVNPMANGRGRCPSVAATRRCSLSSSTTHNHRQRQDEGWSSRPGQEQPKSSLHTHTHTNLKFLQTPT